MIASTERFRHNKWLLSITSGILLGLSFPPFPFPFLQFPAFLLIFHLLSLCSSARQAAYYVYPGYLLWNLIATYWLMMASLAAGIAAIVANAVLMAGVTMLMYSVQKRMTNIWLIALLQASFWVSFEYLHHHWDLSWPWLSIGNGWANATAVIQYISFTGFLGISFWVMVSTALVYHSWQSGTRKLQYGAMGVLLLFPAVSVMQKPFVDPEADDMLETVVVQPNFDSYEDYGGFAGPEQSLQILLQLTDSVRTPATQMVAWPENGIHARLNNRTDTRSLATRVRHQLKENAQVWNATIIGGTPYYEYYAKDDHPALPYYQGDIPYLVYNAAVGFRPDSTYSVYRKHNLVPVVERFPFVHFFNAVDVFGWVNWTAIQSYGKGYNPDQFTVGSTRTPALICYDSVYPGWINNFVNNGAGIITIITNDGWWGNTSGHSQHFAYARLRAIEFRRWVVRSANNGISGIISADGSVKKKTEYWTRTAFAYDVPVITERSFYARYGDWLPTALIAVSIAGIGYLLVLRRRD